MNYKSPRFFADELSKEYNMYISTDDVYRALYKMKLLHNENNVQKLTEEGIARGGRVSGTGFAFSFDYDDLKEEVINVIHRWKR